MSLLKKIFNPRPTFFDILIGGFLIIPWLRDEWDRGTFIISWSLLLFLTGQLSKPKIEYNSRPLILLTIWSLINVFIHSVEQPSTRQLTFKIVNYEIMIEGFLYMLAGVLFIIAVVRYSTNLNYIYLLIPFSAIPWYRSLVRMGSMTPIFALLIAIVCYLFLTKRLMWGILGLISGILGAILNWKWVCLKFASRPMVWQQMAVNLVYRPVRYVDGIVVDPGISSSFYFEKFGLNRPLFLEIKPWLASIFGTGFENSINNTYLWVDKDMFGWSYMQNDFLHLAQCLGPIVLILMVWFLFDCFMKIGANIYLVPFLFVILVCSFQLTMWQPIKSGIYLLLGTVSLAEGIRRRNYG